MSNILDRPLCSECKVNLARKNKNGTFRDKCSTCANGMSRYDRSYTKHKKDYCENEDCMAFIINSKQLVVHHIDSDHYNNDINNLQTLCKNCDALITDKNRDYLNIKYRSKDGV